VRAREGGCEDETDVLWGVMGVVWLWLAYRLFTEVGLSAVCVDVSTAEACSPITGFGHLVSGMGHAMRMADRRLLIPTLPRTASSFVRLTHALNPSMDHETPPIANPSLVSSNVSKFYYKTLNNQGDRLSDESS
jgi:hypothetical protein